MIRIDDVMECDFRAKVEPIGSSNGLRKCHDSCGLCTRGLRSDLLMSELLDFFFFKTFKDVWAT